MTTIENSPNEKPQNIVSHTIEHLVLSGGGIWGFSCYGALRESAKSQFWNISNIKSIYATSVGSMIAILLALKYDWDTIDDFLIKRPWNQVFQFNFYSIFSAVDKRGIFEPPCMYDTFEPLFRGKDISLDITMKEFYEWTGIDIHCFSTEINGDDKMILVDFSHSTHPDWKVLDAVYCSSCLPILFSPFLCDEKCYIDGGIACNYPLSQCIETQCPINIDSVFGIKKSYSKKRENINTKSSIFDYLLFFFTKSISLMDIKNTAVKNQMEIKANATNLYDVFIATSSMEERMKLVEYGAESWREYELVLRSAQQN
jgi:predicted acylesterase/phospholipase RssA